MAQWKIGDQVELKSSGPAMTVSNTNVLNAGNVACVWFEGNKKHEEVFHPDTLKPYRQYDDSGGDD